jgi:hypothetical protein
VAFDEKAKAKAIEAKRAKTGIDPIWLKGYPQTKLIRSQAIQLFCRECMGYIKHRDGNGSSSQGWVMAGRLAKECTDLECPLYRFRPGAKKAGN